MPQQTPTTKPTNEPQRKSRVKKADSYAVLDFEAVAEEMRKAPSGTKWTHSGPSDDELREMLREAGLPPVLSKPKLDPIPK